MSLREELERIAAGAPAADVPPGTWARAQLANRRARALTVAAAAAVVGLVATTMVWLPQLTLQPAGGDADLGVPDHIWAVPDHLGARDEYGSWSRDEVSTDLAVGPAAAAYEDLKGLAVVIGAERGDYHLLDLPGFTKSSGLAVSPDGSRLAYGYTGSGVAGVRVVRLSDGGVRDLPVPARHVRTVAWSSDGQWLAWSGPDGSRSAAGRIGPGTSTSAALEVPGNAALGSLAVSSEGTVVALSRNHVLRWEETEPRRTALSEDPGNGIAGASLDPTGIVVAIGSCCARDAVFVDTVTGRVSTSPLSGELKTTRPLGWLDDEVSIWQVMDQGGGDAGRLALVDPQGDTVTVGSIDGDVPETLTVASGLMSAQQPTVERAQPRWPWSTLRVGVTVALSVTGAVLVLAGVWWWRRRSLGLAPAPRSLAQTCLLLLGGIVAGAGLAVAWGALAVDLVDSLDNDNAIVAALAGVACLSGLGLAGVADRRTRAFGLGVALGAIGAVVVFYVGLLRAIGGA